MIDDRPIMVSIRCITFNQAKYIRQCLDGFVSQKTTFRFEAIVHDDASTDGTSEIIKEYADKYPNIIKPIFEKENQYSKGDGSLSRIVDSQLTGKYVAICEGDDYWPDPCKLQKQVQFLEDNPDYVLSYTNSVVVDENSKRIITRKPKRYEGDCFKSLLLEGNYITTPSVCYRLCEDDGWLEFINSFPFELKMGDKPHWLYLSHKGKFKYQHDIIAAYRLLRESASHSNDIKKALEFATNGEQIALYVNKYYNVGISEDLIKSIYAEGKYRNILKMNTDDYKSLTLEYLKKYPKIFMSPKIIILLLGKYLFRGC